MIINSNKKSVIEFSNKELSTLEQMYAILEGLRDELDDQDIDTFEVCSSEYNTKFIRDILDLCCGLLNDTVIIEESENRER